jgi:hypothetical protein
LERGFHVVFVLRQPVDLVASARLGDRGAILNTGWAVNPRVTVLEMVRQWRKSVAMAVLAARHPRAHLVRYERLVRWPGAWNALCGWLGLEAVPPERLLSGPSGDWAGDWAGNSSFGPLRGLSATPIGRGALLPSSVAAFVRAATAPEQRWLGYERGHPDFIPYNGEAEIDPEHAPGASTAAVQSEREATRRRLLTEGSIGDDAAYRWFLHPLVHSELRRAWVTEEGPIPSG